MSHASVGASDPFPLTMDPSTYVPSPARERTLAQLDAALEAGVVPCLEGPTGIGKTLLLRVFARRIAARYTPLYLPFPLLPAREICALALGLLGRRAAVPPEALLETVAAELALSGRPLVLLLDDAASLPPDSARGLAAILARSRGRLCLVLAGIAGEPLLRALEPFGDGLVRVALEEGVPDAALPGYVAAHLELARAPANLREAFDANALAEIGRLAAGNPRRLHIAAQSIVRRAETAPPVPSQTPPPVSALAPDPVALPAATPPATTIPDATPEAQVTLAAIAAAEPIRVPSADPTVSGPAPIEALPEPRAQADSPRVPPSVAPVSVEALPEPRAQAELHTGPAGEYRIVRGRDTTATPPRDAAAEPSTPEPVPLPPAQIDLTLAPRLAPARPVAPPAARAAAPAAPAHTTTRRDDRAFRRTPPVVLVTVVAAVSAVFGFMLASQLERGRDGWRALVTRIAPGWLAAPEQPSPSVPLPSVPAPEPPSPSAPLPSAPAPVTTTPPIPAPTPESLVPVSAAPAAIAPERVVSSPTAGVPPAVAPEPVAPQIEVSINATPWAHIEIDGQPVGETPLGGVSLSPGSHRFHALFPDGRVSERVVEIDADERTVVFE